ncbi:MAG TPA: alpha/beta hydrolase-fold protein [Thermoanaerobaculia bacterium]|nr:alpha/beta hydrolase-fold protein [Thermoanaerobaculia bacterium]
MNKHVSAAILVLAVLAPAASSRAQEPPTLSYGSVARLPSKTLGEDRRLNVFLPPGYEGSSDKYPVLYLLDGSAHEDYFHVTGLIDFLATYDVMPRTIVIGISNVDRKRDFTPPTKDEKDLAAAPTSGGADKFVSFLETELIPYVDSHYRTADTSTIVGQSLGGLLVTKVLLEKPGLFNNYVIVSPSLWWNHQALLKGAGELVKKNQAPNRKVYISVADEHPEMKATAQSLAEIVKKSGWSNLQYQYDYLDAENHATSLHISVYRAMKYLYKPKG